MSASELGDVLLMETHVGSYPVYDLLPLVLQMRHHTHIEPSRAVVKSLHANLFLKLDHCRTRDVKGVYLRFTDAYQYDSSPSTARQSSLGHAVRRGTISQPG